MRIRVMVLATGLAVTPPLFCGASEPAGAVTEDGAVVATWTGGRAVLDEVAERAERDSLFQCRLLRLPERQPRAEEVLTCARHVAEALALEAAEVTDAGGLEAFLVSAKAEADAARPQAYAAVWSEGRQAEIDAALTEADVLGHYEVNRSRYHRRSSLTLWNIFRRHDDPEHPEVTEAFLKGLSLRVREGEAFESLAREYSHSETRSTGGHIGSVGPGQLPPALESIAFALAEGEVSEPILVKGGAVLLFATDVVDGGDLPFDKVRHRVRKDLVKERLDAEVALMVAGASPPEGSTLLQPFDVIKALDADDPGLVVLRIAGSALTAGQLRARASVDPEAAMKSLSRRRRGEIVEAYEKETRRALLGPVLLGLDDVDLRDDGEARVLETVAGDRVEERLAADAEALLSVDDIALEAHFRRHRSAFRDPLRYDLELWSVAIGDDPVARMSAMQRAHADLEAGRLDFAEAVARHGGTVADLPVGTPKELMPQLPARVVRLGRDIDGPGYTPPVSEAGLIHIVHVQAVVEPEEPSFDAVRERVAEHYVRSTKERRMAAAKKRRLETVGFVFDAEVGEGLTPTDTVEAAPAATP